MERLPRTRNRKSPARFQAEIPVPKSRSKSRGRKKEESNEKSSVTPPKIRLRRSPGKYEEKKKYESTSPSRKKSPARKEDKKKYKSSSPSRTSKAVDKIKKKVKEIRESLTPDRKLVEEVIRNSAQRFEDITSEVVANVKKMTRSTFKEIYDKNKKIEEENDSEAETKVQTLHENNIHGKKSDYTGIKNSILALIMIFLYPSVVFFSQLSCVPGNCSLIPNVTSIDHKKLIDKDGAVWYTGFFIFQLILASLPLGFKSEGILNRGTRLSYRHNGVATLILSLGTLYAIQHFTSFKLIKLLDKTLTFLFVSFIQSNILSLILYFKSLYGNYIRNPQGNTGYHLYDFWIGGEVNPRIGPIDVKTTLLRTSFISLAIYNILVLWKEIEGKTEYSIPLITMCILQIWYSLDFLIFESSFIFSYSITQEGTGYFNIVGVGLFPFWISLFTKYLQITKVSNNANIVVPVVILYIIGYILFRVSTQQKAKYMKNQRGDKYQDVVQDRRSGCNVFRGGLWGYLRHPNYTGVVLFTISWGILAGGVTSLHWIPILIPSISIIEHLIQIMTVEKSQIRASTWTTYTYTAKNRLIPCVY